MQASGSAPSRSQEDQARQTLTSDDLGAQTVVAWGGFLAGAFFFVAASVFLDDRDPRTVAAGLALVLALAAVAGAWWLLRDRFGHRADLWGSTTSLAVVIAAVVGLVGIVRSGATHAWQPFMLLPSLAFLVLAALGLLPGILGRAAILAGGLIFGSYLMLVASFSYGGGGLFALAPPTILTVFEVLLGGLLVGLVGGLGSLLGDGDWPDSLAAASGRIALLSITVAILAFAGTLDMQAEAARAANRRATPLLSGLLAAGLLGLAALVARAGRRRT